MLAQQAHEVTAIKAGVFGKVVKGPAASEIAGEQGDDLRDGRMRSVAFADARHRATPQFTQKQQQLADEVNASTLGCVGLHGAHHVQQLDTTCDAGCRQVDGGGLTQRQSEERPQQGIVMQPTERPTDQISSYATICEAQVPAFFIGMPLPRTQQKDIASMHGDRAMNGAVQCFSTDYQCNFQEIVLVQGCVAFVHRAIDMNRRTNDGKELLAA